MLDGPPDGYVTSAEACSRLGISDRTLRRRVAAGAVDGEYLPRPQGSVLYVRLPSTDAAIQAAPDGNAASDSENDQAAKEAAETATPPTEAPAAITGLLAIVEAERAERQRQAETIRTQAETIGTLRAERDVARADLEAARTELARQAEVRERARSWWDRLRGR